MKSLEDIRVATLPMRDNEFTGFNDWRYARHIPRPVIES